MTVRFAAALACSALGWVAPAGFARAQTAEPRVPAPHLTPPIASPPSEAPTERVQDAKSTAQAAALTPIVPSPRNPLKPAFQLYAEVDLPILGVGVVFASGRLVRSQSSYCAPRCPTTDLNAIDRTTAGYWSPSWQSASNYGLIAVSAGAVALLVADEGVLPALNDGAVVAESALAATAVATVMTLAAGRPRPFLYGEKAPVAERTGPNAGLSYISSHAAVSFAIVTSTVVAMRRLHPHSAAPWLVLGIGGAMASFVTAARVLGGMHFISDSVGGAIVGTSIGVLIPSLHQSPVEVVPVTGAGQHGIALRTQF